MKAKIILASSSPFRRKQMQSLQIEFTHQSPLVDEEKLKTNAKVSNQDLPLFLAQEKAKSLLGPDNQITIGSDQVAFLKDEILRKPKNTDAAIAQLTKMQGQKHRLCTALAVHYKGNWFTHTDETFLYMKNLTRLQIESYVDKDQPIGCAGGYKIEQLGFTLFDKIESQDHTAIIGLPMLALCRALNSFGVSIL